MLSSMLMIVVSSAAADRTWDFAAADLDAVELQLDAADVRVRAGDRVRVGVAALGDCEVEGARDGRTFRLELERPRGSDCDDVEVEVTLPASVAGRIRSGAGNVSLDEVAGSVTVRTGAGDVRGSARSEVDVRTGAGNVELRGLSRPVRVETGAGNLRLDFASVVRGTIRASTGVGNVRIQLASDAPVQAEVSTGMGHTRIGVPRAAGSPTVVKATSGIGNVTIEG